MPIGTPLPELELPELELSPEDDEEPIPPPPEPEPEPEALELLSVSAPPEQAATAKEVKSEASERTRWFIVRVQGRSSAPSSLAKRSGFRGSSPPC